MTQGPVSVAPATAAGSSARRVLAVIVAFVWPSGPGHLVIGHKRRAWAWMGAVAGFLLTAELATVLTGNGRFMIAGLVGILFFHVLSAIDVARLERKDPLPGFRSFLADFLFLNFAMMVLVGGARFGLVESFRIPSASMSPTLRVGDHVFVDKRSGNYTRGDVVVFLYPLDHHTHYIKRLVGLPGDVIESVHGELRINGEPVQRRELNEPCDRCKVYEETLQGRRWVITEDIGMERDFRAVLPPRKYFVVGDNRSNSSDSRVWGFVDADDLRGKVLNIWWSSAPKGGVDWSRFNLQVR